ncbi:MAG TPA: acyl carrier protein phosphodiesterase [Aggregatilineaceae bacterium]|nr:acyl carrier protein phosphodiesterase [Aggregatilineaceae bacterium]
MHQKIDAYTDAHPVVSLSKQLISPLNSRFAGILVDVFYDHFLAKRWTRYSDVPLPVFAQQVYQALLDYETFLPEKLRQILPDFIQQDWLTSYQSLEGVKDALDRISKRLSRENCLVDATNDLQRHYPGLQSHFDEFFPDMVQYIEALPNSGRKLSP